MERISCQICIDVLGNRLRKPATNNAQKECSRKSRTCTLAVKILCHQAKVILENPSPPYSMNCRAGGAVYYNYVVIRFCYREVFLWLMWESIRSDGAAFYFGFHGLKILQQKVLITLAHFLNGWRPKRTVHGLSLGVLFFLLILPKSTANLVTQRGTLSSSIINTFTRTQVAYSYNF